RSDVFVLSSKSLHDSMYFLKCNGPYLNYPTKCNRSSVRKDNTIWYQSNRYRVPLGTYNKVKQVYVEEADNELIIKKIYNRKKIDIINKKQKKKNKCKTKKKIINK